MHDFYVGVLIISLLMVALSAASGLVNNKLWLSEPMLCIVIGIVAGPVCFGWIDETTHHSGTTVMTIEAARLALAIAVVGAALRLPAGYLRRNWRELAVILMPGMILVWLIGGLLAGLILGWPLWPALLLAATLAPTDPVLATSIVSGRFAHQIVPDRLRNTISAEAGANDGLALPLILLPAALIAHVGDGGAAWTMWWQGSLRELGTALVVGTLTGLGSGRLLIWANSKRETEMTSLVTLALALAVATMSACMLLGSDGILACFVAGAWLNEALAGDGEKRHDRFHQAISRFFELPFFVFFGALLPWGDWQKMGWPTLAFGLAILLLRRPLAWLAIGRWLPSLRNRGDHLFAGWFGPIGIAAVFYALHWRDELHISELWPVVSLVALLSLALHGATATPLTRSLMKGI